MLLEIFHQNQKILSFSRINVWELLYEICILVGECTCDVIGYCLYCLRWWLKKWCKRNWKDAGQFWLSLKRAKNEEITFISRLRSLQRWFLAAATEATKINDPRLTQKTSKRREKFLLLARVQTHPQQMAGIISASVNH